MSGTPVVEVSTPYSLGIVIPDTNDLDGATGVITCRYRPTAAGASATWRQCPDAFNRAYSWNPNMGLDGMASDVTYPTLAVTDYDSEITIADLEPATQYEIELRGTDQGQVVGTQTITATTKALPTWPASPSVTSVTTVAGLRACLSGIAAGEVCELADGTYVVDTDDLDISGGGTSGNAAVLTSASRDKNAVIIRAASNLGATAFRLVDLQAVSELIIEHVTFENQSATNTDLVGLGTSNGPIGKVWMHDVSVIGFPKQAIELTYRQGVADVTIENSYVDGNGLVIASNVHRIDLPLTDQAAGTALSATYNAIPATGSVIDWGRDASAEDVDINPNEVIAEFKLSVAGVGDVSFDGETTLYAGGLIGPYSTIVGGAYTPTNNLQVTINNISGTVTDVRLRLREAGTGTTDYICDINGLSGPVTNQDLVCAGMPTSGTVSRLSQAYVDAGNGKADITISVKNVGDISFDGQTTRAISTYERVQFPSFPTVVNGDYNYPVGEDLTYSITYSQGTPTFSRWFVTVEGPIEWPHNCGGGITDGIRIAGQNIVVRNTTVTNYLDGFNVFDEMGYATKAETPRAQGYLLTENLIDRACDNAIEFDKGFGLTLATTNLFANIGSAPLSWQFTTGGLSAANKNIIWAAEEGPFKIKYADDIPAGGSMIGTTSLIETPGLYQNSSQGVAMNFDNGNNVLLGIQGTFEPYGMYQSSIRFHNSCWFNSLVSEDGPVNWMGEPFRTSGSSPADWSDLTLTGYRCPEFDNDPPDQSTVGAFVAVNPEFVGWFTADIEGGASLFDTNPNGVNPIADMKTNGWSNGTGDPDTLLPRNVAGVSWRLAESSVAVDVAKPIAGVNCSRIDLLDPTSTCLSDALDEPDIGACERGVDLCDGDQYGAGTNPVTAMVAASTGAWMAFSGTTPRAAWPEFVDALNCDETPFAQDTPAALVACWNVTNQYERRITDFTSAVEITYRGLPALIWPLGGSLDGGQAPNGVPILAFTRQGLKWGYLFGNYVLDGVGTPVDPDADFDGLVDAAAVNATMWWVNNGPFTPESGATADKDQCAVPNPGLPAGTAIEEVEVGTAPNNYFTYKGMVSTSNGRFPPNAIHCEDCTAHLGNGIVFGGIYDKFGCFSSSAMGNGTTGTGNDTRSQYHNQSWMGLLDTSLGSMTSPPPANAPGVWQAVDYPSAYRLANKWAWMPGTTESPYDPDGDGLRDAVLFNGNNLGVFDPVTRAWRSGLEKKTLSGTGVDSDWRCDTIRATPGTYQGKIICVQKSASNNTQRVYVLADFKDGTNADDCWSDSDGSWLPGCDVAWGDRDTWFDGVESDWDSGSCATVVRTASDPDEVYFACNTGFVGKLNFFSNADGPIKGAGGCSGGSCAFSVTTVNGKTGITPSGESLSCPDVMCASGGTWGAAFYLEKVDGALIDGIVLHPGNDDNPMYLYRF